MHRTIGNTVDVVFICGTDFGTQTSAFCSVPTFRELAALLQAAISDWIHATRWKCFKHSCGSVERFIDSFIEGGIDIINPVQCSATGMVPEQLKEAFGDALVFWGGGVDTQKVLPFGTPSEVREQVLSRCEIFAPGGGFVFNSIHNVQARTPVENIVAMFDAVHEFNGGGTEAFAEQAAMADLKKLYDAVINRRRQDGRRGHQGSDRREDRPRQLISGTMIPAMDEVGRLFRGRRVLRARTAALRPGHERLRGS